MKEDRAVCSRTGRAGLGRSVRRVLGKIDEDVNLTLFSPDAQDALIL
jgi:hypothetical protein